MNKYVKIKFNGKNFPTYLHYVDENYQWGEEKIKSENSKAVEIAKMAFLDHGTPMIPIDDLSTVMAQKAAYLTPARGVVFLIYEGGNFMTLLPQMEIIEEVYSEHYPIENGSAIVCENDAFDKRRGGLDHVFLGLAKLGGANSFHYMLNFKSRTEAEIIEAFKNTPAIIFWSSHIEVEWWELMLRCIIKSKTKAKVIGKRNSGDTGLRFDKCIEFAEKFGISVLTS
jgi:hypothetical protein